MAQSELLCTDLTSVEAALRLGVDRIELCAALEVGGVTPGAGLLGGAVERVRGTSTELVVLIRPRAGDFVHDAGDERALLLDVAAAGAAGAHGVAVGALRPDHTLDLELTRRMVAESGPLKVTFHRAIDHAADRAAVLDQLAEMGVDRVLTSGGAPSAWQGRDAIAEMVRRAGGRLEIVAAGGVRGENAAELLSASGAHAIHGSCTASAASAGLTELPDLGSGGSGGSGGRIQMDLASAQRFVEAARTEGAG